MSRIFGVYLFLLISCNHGATGPAPLVRAPSQEGASPEDQNYFDLLNRHRRHLGLETLISHPHLDMIALQHSEAMATKRVPFGHTGSSLRCSDARLTLGGGNLCGEIVATGQGTVQAVLDSWLSSLGHRAHLENSRYTHTGMGFATDHRGVRYWAQIFLEVR